MPYARWLVAFAALTIAAIGPAQAQDYRARDGSTIFSLSGAAVQAAYDAFCMNRTAPRCDTLDHYDLHVIFDVSSARLNFIHHSFGPAIPGMAMSFSCTQAGQTFACSSSS